MNRSVRLNWLTTWVRLVMAMILAALLIVSLTKRDRDRVTKSSELKEIRGIDAGSNVVSNRAKKI